MLSAGQSGLLLCNHQQQSLWVIQVLACCCKTVSWAPHMPALFAQFSAQLLKLTEWSLETWKLYVGRGIDLRVQHCTVGAENDGLVVALLLTQGCKSIPHPLSRRRGLSTAAARSCTDHGCARSIVSGVESILHFLLRQIKATSHSCRHSQVLQMAERTIPSAQPTN